MRNLDPVECDRCRETGSAGSADFAQTHLDRSRDLWSQLTSEIFRVGLPGHIRNQITDEIAPKQLYAQVFAINQCVFEQNLPVDFR